ncbi:MAG TPA: T9SS type A sorting domain-containing protein [Bacteroidales bacterium]|nr:T9SS type A sorting domain-containing protein [Bacteroidales bacterium]
MKRFLSIALFVVLFLGYLQAQTPWTERTYIKITLDTKLMQSLDCSLGGGSSLPATWDRVYAHLGLCTCNEIENGSQYTRDCSSEFNNLVFCLNQITPYQSRVWQHVVGNWGDNPQDDGVGLMESLGNGVYTIDFILEDYFSSNEVSTEGQTIDGVLYPPSTPWDMNQGGKPYTMGMVFRNHDGTSSGRDDLCKDLFIIDIMGLDDEDPGPKVVQGYDQQSDFHGAIEIEVEPASIEDILRLSDLTQIYPNPFNSSFNIDFKLVAPINNINIKIYDILGKEVATIFNGTLNPGRHIIEWNGEEIPNGLYFVSITNNNVIAHTERILKTK